MNSFWDNSWENVDTERVTQYVNEFDLEPDDLINYLTSKNVKTVCDAGCGCGIYSLKLASNGFIVSGFDVSVHAVKVAQNLLEKASVTAKLKTASILETGYSDNQFDGVVSRDVIDHMSKKDAAIAIQELYRITKPGGIVLFTVDYLDSEYETETHIVNEDGDFVFTEGKWKGMIFHPYSKEEIIQMIPAGAVAQVEEKNEEITVKIMKY